MSKLCIGYDANGKGFACPNKPGTPWTHLWCPECDQRRLNRISQQLRKLQEEFRRLEDGEQ